MLATPDGTSATKTNALGAWTFGGTTRGGSGAGCALGEMGIVVGGVDLCSHADPITQAKATAALDLITPEDSRDSRRGASRPAGRGARGPRPAPGT